MTYPNHREKFTLNRLVRPTLFLTVITMLGVVAPVAVHADQSSTSGLAWFDDHWIDLSIDWEDAAACDVAPDITTCFRTEAELDRYLRQDYSASTGAAILATCSSALRLYDGTSYGGTVLSLSTRGIALNLSTYGFDNLTSSYKVGACESEFYSLASLGGSAYPGNTAALAQASSMLVGWNNIVSSVIIY